MIINHILRPTIDTLTIAADEVNPYLWNKS